MAQKQKGAMEPAPFEEYKKQDFVKVLAQVDLAACGGITLAKVQLEPIKEMMGVILNNDTIFTMHRARSS